jgi:hypothetical protein
MGNNQGILLVQGILLQGIVHEDKEGIHPLLFDTLSNPIRQDFV